MLEGIKNWKRRREEEKKKARRTAVTEFAAASGLSYSETDRNVIDKLSYMSIMSVKMFLFLDGSVGSWPGLVYPENILSGRWQGLPVAEADSSISTASAETWPRSIGPAPMLDLQIPRFENKRVSALIADLPADLPDLMIQRAMPWLGDRQAKLSVVAGQAPRYHIESVFDREWWVATANTAFAAKLIDASMITWLLSAREAFMFKLYGRNLLVWSYLLSAPGLGAIFDTAKSFTDHIPSQVWAEFGTR